jgi:hypothetical protein
MTFSYDGKTMSLYCKANNEYATLTAPSTIDATIDKVRKDYQADAPGADLLFSKPYDVLSDGLKRGQVIGQEAIDGVLTNHLAFQQEGGVDWQIWVKDGPDPVPLRYVITTTSVKAQPQFTVQLSHWEPNAAVSPATFDYKPPADATKVDAFPTKCRVTK